MQGSNYKKLKIGELLVSKGKVTPWHVEEALAKQAEWRLRIGSCLVGLGHLSLDDITQCLAEQLGVPAATRDAFDAATPEIIATVPRDLCAKHQIFPLQLEGRRLKLALLDPNDLNLVDSLAFSLGYIIQAVSAPQLRLLHYLKRHQLIRWDAPFADTYDEDKSLQHVYTVRYERLAEHRQFLPELALGLVAELATTQPLGEICRRSPLNPDRVLKVVEKLVALGIIEAQTRDTSRIVDASPDSTLGSTPGSTPSITPGGNGHGHGHTAATVNWGAAPAPTHTPPAPRPPTLHTPGAPSFPVPSPVMSPKSILEGIAASTDRDELFHFLVQPVLEHTSLTVLFVVRGTLATGFRSSWQGATKYQVESLAVPLTSPSLFQHAYRLGTIVRGRARDDETQYQIAARLGAPKPKEICIAPITIKNRVVNLICIHSFDGTTFPDGAVEGLRILTQRAVDAYGRILQYRGG